MFIEIALISGILGVICALAALAKDGSRFLIVSFIFIILMTGGVFGFYSSWQHETKTIEISDKMIIGSYMKVVGSDGVVYDVLKVEDYSRLKTNQSFTVNIASNYDNRNIPGGYIYHNIDGVTL